MVPTSVKTGNEIRVRIGDIDAGRVTAVPGEEALARVEQGLRAR